MRPAASEASVRVARRRDWAPTQTLKAKTQFTIHGGVAMRDNPNHMVGLERNGMTVGGQWAAGNMMGGNTRMMGAGWQNANAITA
jgi:hypothetical protein